jgi:hypothetical protein
MREASSPDLGRPALSPADLDTAGTFATGDPSISWKADAGWSETDKTPATSAAGLAIVS